MLPVSPNSIPSTILNNPTVMTANRRPGSFTTDSLISSAPPTANRLDFKQKIKSVCSKIHQFLCNLPLIGNLFKVRLPEHRFVLDPAVPDFTDAQRDDMIRGLFRTNRSPSIKINEGVRTFEFPEVTCISPPNQTILLQALDHFRKIENPVIKAFSFYHILSHKNTTPEIAAMFYQALPDTHTNPFYPSKQTFKEQILAANQYNHHGYGEFFGDRMIAMDLCGNLTRTAAGKMFADATLALTL